MGCGGRFRRQAWFAPDETPIADGEVVWSWRRDAGVKLRGKYLADDGGNKPLTGKSAKQAVKPLRRGCRSVLRSPVCSCAPSFAHLWHTRPRVQRAPGIPCALFLRVKISKLGHMAPRDRGDVSGWSTSAAQRGAHHARQVGFSIGLRQQQHAGVEPAVMHDGILSVAGREQYLEGGPASPRPRRPADGRSWRPA